MSSFPFRPIGDTHHFPILNGGSDKPLAALAAADGLTFYSVENVEAGRRLASQQGLDWHSYGDSRWATVSAWVEFQLIGPGFRGDCGVLVTRVEIPAHESDPFGWSAKNNPLQWLFPHERTGTATIQRTMLLRQQSIRANVEMGPDDRTPRHVQCYCIYLRRKGVDVEFAASYTDLLNAAGIPIPVYRTASLQTDDVAICRNALSALFHLNAGRLAGTGFVQCGQLMSFVPAFTSGAADIAKWVRFHPSRVMRSREVLRGIQPTMELIDGLMLYEDHANVASLRRDEFNLHMLAFEREVRPSGMAVVQSDINASMTAFSHRINGGAIYVLPNPLVDEFHNTDCGEVQVGDIDLPFSNLFLKFTPQPPILLGPCASVDGCYLARQGDEIQIILTSRQEGVDYQHSVSVTCIDPTFAIRLPASDPAKSIIDAVQDGINDFLKTNAPPSDDLSTTIKQPDGTETRVVDVRAQSRERRIELFHSQESAFRDCLNIVVNAACFITFRPDDMVDTWDGTPPSDLLAAANEPGNTRKKREKRKDAERRIANGDYTRIKLCGAALFAEPRDGVEGMGISPRAHWRRGHWRRQRHGTGLSLIILKWIRPTVVRQDNGPFVEDRFYEVPET